MYRVLIILIILFLGCKKESSSNIQDSEIEISNSHLGNVSVNFKELDGNWSEYLLITSFFKKHNII